MAVHTKKIYVEYFEKILTGEKTYEVRLADRECHPGDTLILQERDPVTQSMTGRIIEKEISAVCKTKDIQLRSIEDIEKYGLQILSFK